MIKLEEINPESWGEMLKSNSPDDIETIRFLQEQEKEILNILIDNSEEKINYETAEISCYDILNADDKFVKWIDKNTK